MSTPDAIAMRTLTEVARAQDGVVTTSDVHRSGLSAAAARRHVRRGDWVPMLRGTHLLEPHRTGWELERVRVRSALLVAPRATVGLASAARLTGFVGAPEPRGVQVVVPPGSERARRPGLEPHAFALSPREVVRLRGFPLTHPVRTLSDLVPRLPRAEALAVLDSALRSGLVSREGLAQARLATEGRRGCRAVADLWVLADARAESPLESRVRLLRLEAGLVPDVLQLEVRDGTGRFVARCDLAFTGRSRPGALPLLLEADGRGPHDTPEALYRDRDRANRLVALGYEVLRCTWSDTRDPGRIPALVRAAL